MVNASLKVALALLLVVPGAAAAAAAAPQTPPEPSTAPAKVPGKAKKKAKKRRKKVAKEPEEPKDQPEAPEETRIEPSFIYRSAALTPVRQSVYERPEYHDYADQLYLTLLFQKTYDYQNTVVLEPSFRTARDRPTAWDPFVVEQAYIDSALTDSLLVTAGKKTEYGGSGFFVNPSDLLNEGKDLFDPLYQQEGVVFTRLKYHTDDYSLGLGFIPYRGNPAEAGRAWLTGSAEVLQTDIRLQMTYSVEEKTTTGLSVQRFFGDRFELHFDGRYQARQRDPTDTGDSYVKYSAYMGPNGAVVGSQPSGYYVAGSRFVLTARRTLVAEAIDQQSGLMPGDFARRYADLRTNTQQSSVIEDPPTQLIGRHYGLVSYQDDESVPRTHLSASYLENADDKSYFAVLSARYSLSKITSVELAPTFFKGALPSEFGGMPFSQVIYLTFRGRF